MTSPHHHCRLSSVLFDSQHWTVPYMLCRVPCTSVFIRLVVRLLSSWVFVCLFVTLRYPFVSLAVADPRHPPPLPPCMASPADRHHLSPHTHPPPRPRLWT
ncbi:hypothetical protein VTO73DRAFT_5776 [Trametes versicolor]